MYIKPDYFYFLAFDLKEKASKILKYIQPSSGEKHNQEWETN